MAITNIKREVDIWLLLDTKMHQLNVMAKIYGQCGVQPLQLMYMVSQDIKVFINVILIFLKYGCM